MDRINRIYKIRTKAKMKPERAEPINRCAGLILLIM
jgi:hypothetical protein